jgi:hypothetical protein
MQAPILLRSAGSLLGGIELCPVPKGRISCGTAPSTSLLAPHSAASSALCRIDPVSSAVGQAFAKLHDQSERPIEPPGQRIAAIRCRIRGNTAQSLAPARPEQKPVQLAHGGLVSKQKRKGTFDRVLESQLRTVRSHQHRSLDNSITALMAFFKSKLPGIDLPSNALYPAAYAAQAKSVRERPMPPAPGEAKRRRGCRGDPPHASGEQDEQ